MIAGTVGLLLALIMNLIGTIAVSVRASAPAFAQGSDQRFLALLAWGFMVPFVWGFSARWLPTFLGLPSTSDRGLRLLVGINISAVLLVSNRQENGRHSLRNKLILKSLIAGAGRGGRTPMTRRSADFECYACVSKLLLTKHVKFTLCETVQQTV